MNSLDPRAKRLRLADTSLAQARNALQGVTLALGDLPRSGISRVTEALEAVQRALEAVDEAAAAVDAERLENRGD